MFFFSWPITPKSGHRDVVWHISTYSTVQRNIHRFISTSTCELRIVLVLHFCRKTRDNSNFKKVRFKALSCEKPLKTSSFLSTLVTRRHYRSQGAKINDINMVVLMAACVQIHCSVTDTQTWLYLHSLSTESISVGHKESKLSITLISTIKNNVCEELSIRTWRTVQAKRLTLNRVSFVKSSCGFRAGLDVGGFFCVCVSIALQRSPAPASVAFCLVVYTPLALRQKSKKERAVIGRESPSICKGG